MWISPKTSRWLTQIRHLVHSAYLRRARLIGPVFWTPMTAFFALSETLAMGERAACEGRVPVFDGKQRYNLRLEPGGREQIRTRAWSGEASVCRAWYEPVSGYDPEDYPTEAEMRQPLTIWLAPLLDGQLQLPVRIYTRAGLGGVTIEAKTIELEELE
jgi:hypothetical protein